MPHAGVGRTARRAAGLENAGSLVSLALRTIRRQCGMTPTDRVLVAVSGGPDSVALLHVLRALHQRGELVVAGLGHFNHQLRGREADADEQFCRDLAGACGLPIEAGRADVLTLARESGRSIEDTARAVRYGFLEQARERLRADVVAVGHSLDDQAETFLLRLIRGAGARGLSGIRPRAGRVVRPLLDVRRDALRQYAAELDLAFREDASNADVTIPRNRVRHELIPYLEEYSPAIVETLARAASVAREDEEYLGRAAIDLSTSIVLETECGVEIDVEALAALPAALASRVVRQALGRTASGRFIGFRHIARVMRLAEIDGGTESSVALPGQIATRSGGRILLRPPGRVPFSNFLRFPLSIPGEVSLAGWAVSAERIEDGVRLPETRARGAEVVVAAGPLRSPLAVRTRRQGDRFRPLGMGGRGRKLQDFLVDRKVPRRDRDSLPLVVDQDDRIVWVVGQSLAEDFRVTAPELGVILLKARRLGG